MSGHRTFHLGPRGGIWLPLAGLLLLSSAAQGMYDPHHGRWFQRDPLGVRLDAPRGKLGAEQQYADGMSLHNYAKGNPQAYVDPQGTETGTTRPCKEVVYPDVTVQRIKNALGHQWLNIQGAFRGFYPVGNSSIPLITDGAWYDETQINQLYYEFPPGSGNWILMPRVFVFIANGWYDQWDTRRLCNGKLESGSAKGAGCCCAKPGEIIDCLLEVTKPATSGLYLLIGGNCINHSEDALSRCCLRKNKQTYFGKPVPNGGTSGS